MTVSFLALGVLSFLAGPLCPSDKGCLADVQMAFDKIEESCGQLLRSKEIDLDSIKKDFLKRASDARNDQEQYVLLLELLAKIEDGHAVVTPSDAVRSKVQFPEDFKREPTGPGLFICTVGDRVYVKAAWESASKAGLKAGFEIVEVEGKPSLEWLSELTEEVRLYRSFSTDHQARYFACHWGLRGDPGSVLTLQARKDDESPPRTFKIKRKNASYVALGPVSPPKKLKSIDRLSYGLTESGFGYVHLRDCPSELPDMMDDVLKKIGNVPGLILDFRANGGGGFDHDALLARFVPKGKELKRAKAYPIPSAGDTPYGGPVVVIIDAGVRSAGETGSGMFKEDGRAYMIGDSPTAGMSARKTSIQLPSGKFSLRVSTSSNKGRFNRGKGIEGIGIIPHEIVEYDPVDLAEGNDTLLLRAEAVLLDFPQKSVPYDPNDYGWKAGK